MLTILTEQQLGQLIATIPAATTDYKNKDNALWQALRNNTAAITEEVKINFVFTLAKKYKLIPSKFRYKTGLKILLERLLVAAPEQTTRDFIINLLSVLNPEKYKNYTEQLIKRHNYPANFSGSEEFKLLRQKLVSQPAANLIGVALSPQRQSMIKTTFHTVSLADSETYYRSDKSPIYKFLGKSIHMNPDSLDKNGMRAHLGGYLNPMHALGDITIPDAGITPITSKGKGVLYEKLLNFRYRNCFSVLNYLAKIKKIAFSPDQQFSIKLNHLTVGYYHQYPCIMVHIASDTAYALDDKYTNATFEAWVNLLGSFFIGLVNYLAFTHKFPLEMTRRSGFGFLTPTLAATGNSFRINMGIFPYDYTELLAKALVTLDDILSSFKTRPLPEIPADCFYRSAEHVEYLGGVMPSELTHILQLLWQKVESKGRTALYNLTRTSYILEGIAAHFFNSLITQPTINYSTAFFASLRWAISRMQMLSGSLSVNQTDDFAYQKNFAELSPCKIIDIGFWDLVHFILDQLKKLPSQSAPDYYQERARLRRFSRNISHDFFTQLCTVVELLFSTVIGQEHDRDEGDFFGSDSEIERNIKGKKIYSKKIILHNGMQAIWAALEIASLYCKEPEAKKTIYIGAMYYEVESAFEEATKQHKFIQVHNKSDATVLMYDLNMCITDSRPAELLTISPNLRVLIIDITSSHFTQLHQLEANFIASSAEVLLFVSSGFKHEQLGSDKNPYGTLRIITKNKALLATFYLEIKKTQLPILSQSSHRYRRAMKKLGAVPTSQQIFLKN